MSKPIIAIVGRPNVGKSALFNRLAKQRLAVVEDFAGVTRDRLYVDTDFDGRTVSLVDTGGFDPTEKEGLMPSVVAQARFAISEAEVIVFVLDARHELTALDFAVAEELRKTRKPIIVAVNKADNARQLNSFDELGLPIVIPVSALHGRNIDELIEAIVAVLPPEQGSEAEVESVKIAIVGRPNVGKSSLLNAILGEERSIVSDQPGTTRDAIDTRLDWGGHTLTLIDTAGMRRKAKVKQAMEYHTVLRALRAIDRADVVFLVVESGGLAEQDAKIGGYAHEAGKSVILVVNKWDLIEKQLAETDPRKRKRQQALVRGDFQRHIHNYLAFMDYAMVLYVSALTGDGVHDLLHEALRLVAQANTRVPTAQLNAVVRTAVAKHSPPTFKNRKLKVKYATQVAVQPPTIVVFVNDPELMHFSYRRYLENELRAAFGFEGAPLRMFVRSTERMAPE